MTPHLVTLLGIGATVCSTTSFAPQAWRIIRTGDTEAISAPMYLLTVGGFGIWLAYGWLKLDWPLVVTNAICLGLSAFILLMKLLPSRRRREVAAKLDPTETRHTKPPRLARKTTSRTAATKLPLRRPPRD